MYPTLARGIQGSSKALIWITGSSQATPVDRAFSSLEQTKLEYIYIKQEIKNTKSNIYSGILLLLLLFISLIIYIY